jgi:endonuclease/exonuclease/phosphatase family metal-dependent hydrolase
MKLKTVSFNIRCCDDENGNSIAERAPRLFSVIEPYDPDVIGFQEYTPAWENQISKLFSADYDIFLKYRSTTGWLECGPIMWKRDKFEKVDQGYFWLSDTPEIESFGGDECKHNRICTYVILRDIESDKKFTFMNTHFGFGTEYQVKSARLICEFARKISDYPTFITGDFNLTPESEAYPEILKYFKDSNALTANDWRATYHGYDVSKNTDGHIDYCFVDDKIKPLCSRIMDELVDGKFPSDHFGLYTELEIC